MKPNQLVYAQEQYLIQRDILEDYFDAKKIAQLNLEKQKLALNDDKLASSK